MQALRSFSLVETEILDFSAKHRWTFLLSHHAEWSTQCLQLNVLQMMSVMSLSLWHQVLTLGPETCVLVLESQVLGLKT